MESLIAQMPDDVHEAFDPMTHTSPAELVWLCMHLLDLSDEGENEIDKKAVKKFRDACIGVNKGSIPYIG